MTFFLAIISLLIVVAVFVEFYNSSQPHVDLDILHGYIHGEVSEEEFDDFLDKNMSHFAYCKECEINLHLMWRMKDKM
jgi:hypothetical protein